MLDVIYLDNHLLVVNKPPGMLAQSDVTGDLDLLTAGKAYLKRRFDKPGNVYLGLVHRLDRPASGVMVFARTSKAAARLTRLFREHRIDKHYLAVVEGDLTGNGVWEDHMVKDGRNARIVAAGAPKAKHAKLAWRALAHHQGLSLAQVELFTGRAHQIRLQFASRGYPLLGDMRYRAKHEFDGANLALHAYYLGFTHPVGGRACRFSQEPPALWHGFFDREIQGFIDGLVLSRPGGLDGLAE